MSEGKKHGSYTDCQFESLPLNDIDNFLTVIKTECKLKIKSKWYSFKLKWLKKKHMEITQLIFQILYIIHKLKLHFCIVEIQDTIYLTCRIKVMRKLWKNERRKTTCYFFISITTLHGYLKTCILYHWGIENDMHCCESSTSGTIQCLEFDFLLFLSLSISHINRGVYRHDYIPKGDFKMENKCFHWFLWLFLTLMLI